MRIMANRSSSAPDLRQWPAAAPFRESGAEELRLAMIRINLLGQIRPKAARRPVDTGAAMPAVFIGAGLGLGALGLGFFYFTWQRQLEKENAEIKRLTAQKTELEQTKQQVELFDKQKELLQRRVSTIEQLA